MITYNIFSFVDSSDFISNVRTRANYIGMLNNFELENQGKFILIDVVQNNKCYSIGLVISANYEQCKCFVAFDMLFIGYDDEIAIFSNGDILNKDIYQHQFVSFYDFILAEKVQILLAIFEIGIVAFDNKGIEKWNVYCDDIISDYELDNNILMLHTFENEIKYIDINNGTYIN